MTASRRHNKAIMFPSDFRFELAPVRDLADLSVQWRDLEERADASFFQSWSWIGTWLATLPPGLTPLLARCESNGKTIALGILMASRSRRHLLWRPHRLCLNETGLANYDSLFIEYNGWLIDRGYSELTPGFALHSLTFKQGLGDEIVLSGVDEHALTTMAAPGYRQLIGNSLPAFMLDLTSNGIADLSRFGKNTRYQIRRTQRDYAAFGATEILAARDSAEAQVLLDNLKNLHQAYWRARGRPGAFANPFFEQFHRRLITACWDRGEIELLRVRAGDQTVGLLYNFIHRGRVYAYQSGFDYSLLPRSRPGLLCHWLAIERHRTAGRLIYDFLAGDNRMKRSLSSRTTQLHWVVLQRETLSARFERSLAQMIARLRWGAAPQSAAPVQSNILADYAEAAHKPRKTTASSPSVTPPGSSPP